MKAKDRMKWLTAAGFMECHQVMMTDPADSIWTERRILICAFDIQSIREQVGVGLKSVITLRTAAGDKEIQVTDRYYVLVNRLSEAMKRSVLKGANGEIYAYPKDDCSREG